jgi:hypothetical protein
LHRLGRQYRPKTGNVDRGGGGAPVRRAPQLGDDLFVGGKVGAEAEACVVKHAVLVLGALHSALQHFILVA